jgi:hypothetical protein
LIEVWKHQLQLLAVFRADAVGALFPAGGFSSRLVGLVDVELPLRGLGAEALGVVQEVGVAMPVRP